MNDPLDDPPPADDDGYDNVVVLPVVPASVNAEGVIPLGHDRGVFFYYSRAATQVYGFTAGAHSPNALMQLASVPHFWQRSQFVSEKTGAIRWGDAIDWLMRQCRDVGIYDPERIRGRGAWLDNGRPVLHLGDRLIVAGHDSPLMLPASRCIYEGALPLSAQYADPLSTTSAHKLAQICDRLPWQNPLFGKLLTGFIVTAPICGALFWRSSIWMTGSAGSGKSWVEQNVMNPAIGGMALRLGSKTTEPGIRQALGSDALPVLFDEFEGEDGAAAARVQSVLDLMRAASSEGGARIAKGSQNQSGAKMYRIRSCFAFSSINVGLQHRADQSRVSVLSLASPDKRPEKVKEAAARFADLNRLTQETITSEWVAGLLARSVRLLPVIRANAETFARAVAIALGSRRSGDQIGTLLAGAYAVHSDQAITPEAAEAWIARHDLTMATGSLDDDETRCLSQITQHRFSISPGNGGAVQVTVGRLMMAASGHDDGLARDTAQRELKQIGIRFAQRDGHFGYWFSTGHSFIKGVLKNTPWASGWGLALGRLPGGASSERLTIRFGPGHTARAAWVPMDAVTGRGALDVDAADIPF